MRRTGHHRLITLVALLLLGAAGCGSDWGLLITVRCNASAEPPCILAVPTDVDALRIHLTQPAVGPPPFDRTFSLAAGDSFPVSVSILAGDDAREGAVIAEVDALLDNVVVADGTSSGPLRDDEQVEIVVELRPL